MDPCSQWHRQTFTVTWAVESHTSRYREDVIHNTDIVYYKNTDVLEIIHA